MPEESNGGQGGALGQVQLQEEQGSPKEQQQDAVLDQEGQATLPGQGSGEEEPQRQHIKLKWPQHSRQTPTL